MWTSLVQSLKHRGLTFEAGVPVEEELEEAVDLLPHSVGNLLCIRGAGVEQYVQQRVIGEVTQLADAVQCDRF